MSRNVSQWWAVFCGARAGASAAYAKAANELGAELGRRDFGLVYGGAGHGLMGALADGALSAGAPVVGVIPKGLLSQEFAHPKLTELVLVDSMHERKARMAERAHGFIAMPGGFGTLDELFEAVTWVQIGIHQKPIGVLNTQGFFDPLLSFVAKALEQGFIAPSLATVLVADPHPHALLDRLATHVSPAPAVRWIPSP